MDEALWHRLEPHLDRILDLDTAAREDYLERQLPPDPELREELERLLDECVSADGFLDAETLDVAKQKALDQSFQETLVDRRFGAYRSLEVLGRGGMGTVLSAERADGQFEHRVAIKVVSPERLGPEGIERFRFERQILANLEHPNIAKLLDGGVTEDGLPYLIMELVDGVPLDRRLVSVGASVEDRLRLMIEVCSAIDHAHRRRVAHLDLKPSNILVTADGRPKVVDFGISQMLDRQSATSGSGTSGRMTPQYASPEQLRGEAVTNACDVYSLGVVLFRILTGRLPFERREEPLDNFIRRVSEEPAPRPSSVAGLPFPRELDAVVRKALGKDPADRYASASDLADDLERILACRPVKALPPSRVYGLSKHVQRHRWSWLAGALTVAVVGVLLAGWWRDRQTTRARLEITRNFAQEAEAIEGFLRYAYALPAHDVGREKILSFERMQRLHEQMKAVGAMAEGPGHLALGRAELMLYRPHRARDHLQRAWDLGLRSPDVAFSLGKALGQMYRREHTAALGIRDPELRALEEARLREELRDPALALLARVESVSEVASPSLTEAMVALLEDRAEDALAPAERAEEETPWLPDGRRLQGEAWRQLAEGHLAAGRWDEALDGADRALEALDAASLLAPSDPLIAELRCDVEVLKTVPARMQRASQNQETALETCRGAVALDPDLNHARLQLARLYVYGVQDPSLSLDERLSSLERGRLLAREALLKEADSSDALVVLGSAELTRAVFLSRAKGEDPREDLESAATALGRATELSPGSIVAHVNLGTSLALLAEERLARGGDPDPAFARAIESFQQALDRSPNHGAILTNLGNLLFNRAVFKRQHGEEASDLLRRSIEVGERSLQVNPELITAHNLQVAAYDALAQVAVARGESGAAEKRLQKAREALEEAKALNPSYPLPWVNEGALFLTRAHLDELRGEDPEPALEQCEAALMEARRLSTDPHEELYANLAECRLALLRFRESRGLPVVRSGLGEAEQGLDEALEVHRVSALLRIRKAQIVLYRALASDDETVRRALLDEALALVTRVLDDRPALAEALYLAAEIDLRLFTLGESSDRLVSAEERLRALGGASGLGVSGADYLRALVDRARGSRDRPLPDPGVPFREQELRELGRRIDALRPLDTRTGPGAAAPGP